MKINAKRFLLMIVAVVTLLSCVSCGEENNKGRGLVKPGGSVSGTDWNMTFLKAKTYKSIRYGEYYSDTAENGKIYLVLFFEIENLSDKDKSFSALYLDSYLDGYKVNEKYLLTDVEGFDDLDGTVASGKKKKGYIAWEVAENWYELAVTYRDGITTDSEKYEFVVASSDIEKSPDTVPVDTSATKENDTSAANVDVASSGDTLTGENWKMTLISAKTFKKIPAENEYLSSSAKEGKIYILLFIEAENVSKNDNSISSFNTEGYADGYKVDNEYLLTDVEGYSNFSGSVAAGKKTRGFIAFQIDENWSEFEMIYKDGYLSTSEKYKFTVKSDETE